MGRLYDSVEWRRLRMVKLAHNPLCEECSTLARHVPATEVDHVISVARGGGALDLENLRSLCRKCHSRKTAEIDGGFGRDRRERMRVRGCTPDGMPRDPEHPWRAASKSPIGDSTGETSRDREAPTPCAPLRGRFPGF